MEIVVTCSNPTAHSGTTVFTGESGAFSVHCKTSMVYCSSVATLSDTLSSFMTVWNPGAPQGRARVLPLYSMLSLQSSNRRAAPAQVRVPASETAVEEPAPPSCGASAPSTA